MTGTRWGDTVIGITVGLMIFMPSNDVFPDYARLCLFAAGMCFLMAQHP